MKWRRSFEFSTRNLSNNLNLAPYGLNYLSLNKGADSYPFSRVSHAARSFALSSLLVRSYVAFNKFNRFFNSADSRFARNYLGFLLDIRKKAYVFARCRQIKPIRNAIKTFNLRGFKPKIRSYKNRFFLQGLFKLRTKNLRVLI